MLVFVMSLLMIWIGVKVNMPIWFFVILTAGFLLDSITAAYKAGKEEDNEK